MAPVPAGSFLMGDTFAEGDIGERPTHTVNVSAFCMDTNLVSYALWTNIYQWATSHGYSFDHAGGGKAADHPVQQISWYDMVKWCNARSEKEGLTPCYYTDASQATPYRSGSIDLGSSDVKWTANGYRLPTEAEWEKAARGGAAGHRFPWTVVDTIDWSRANYYASPGTWSYEANGPGGYNPTFLIGGLPYTSPVGSFAPNGYGLYDMAGNLFEWCWDWYDGAYYSSSPGTDPRGRGPASGDPSRVLRGGSWAYLANNARCADRLYNAPAYAFNHVGFRCVRGQ
jgi:formylglycine-generating enzyme required for sulfatase activity